MAGIVQLTADGTLVLRFPYDPNLNDQLRDITGNRVRWSSERRGFILPSAQVRADHGIRQGITAFAASQALHLGEGVSAVLANPRPRLHAAMLPASTWGSNLRGILTQAQWDRLRIPVCDAAGNQCEICRAEVRANGRQRRPDCHEVWAFETIDDRSVQRLLRLIALCPGCHGTQHVGRAVIEDEEDHVIRQLCTVNGWAREEAVADLHRAGDLHDELSTIDWDLDLSALTGQVTMSRFANLYVPAADRSRLGRSRGTR